MSKPLTPQMTDLPYPYLLFLGDTTIRGYAKTAFRLARLAPIAAWENGRANARARAMPVYFLPKAQSVPR